MKILELKSKKIVKEIPDFVTYILDNCTAVKIVTDNEQEAFQFFDSQNSRGKALEPHDLLKSYHLREMNDESEDLKKEIINKWENTDSIKLVFMFYSVLYPLVRWYKGENGLYYSVKDIKTFKGLKQNSIYNFVVYHKAANLYLEHFNSNEMFELISSKKIQQFQLTQPIISGKRFFLYVQNYIKLYDKINKLIDAFLDKKTSLDFRKAGNRYIKNLFINSVIFFADKFGYDKITNDCLEFFYRWSFSLRIVMYSVGEKTIDKYALGSHDRLQGNKNIFKFILDMQTPEELELFYLENIDKNKINEKYDDLFKNIFGGNND